LNGKKTNKKPGILSGIAGHFLIRLPDLNGIRAMATFAIDIDEPAGQPFEEADAVGAGKGVQGAG
jgi:hypothetical protein